MGLEIDNGPHSTGAGWQTQQRCYQFQGSKQKATGLLVAQNVRVSYNKTVPKLGEFEAVKVSLCAL